MQTNQNFTGAESRRMKRENDPKAFTRNQALKAIANTTDEGVLQKFTKHSSPHVQNAALAKHDRLLGKVPYAIVQDPFLDLVARFKAEGKANPEKSARASLAAKAKRKAS